MCFFWVLSERNGGSSQNEKRVGKANNLPPFCPIGICNNETCLTRVRKHSPPLQQKRKKRKQTHPLAPSQQCRLISDSVDGQALSKTCSFPRLCPQIHKWSKRKCSLLTNRNKKGGKKKKMKNNK
jgi:hypothetical protein